MKINKFFQNACVAFQRKKFQVGMGLGVIFLPGKKWVYSEFLPSEGIPAGIKIMKWSANAEAIHLLYAVQIMIRCLIFPVSYNINTK